MIEEVNRTKENKRDPKGSPYWTSDVAKGGLGGHVPIQPTFVMFIMPCYQNKIDLYTLIKQSNTSLEQLTVKSCLPNYATPFYWTPTKERIHLLQNHNSEERRNTIGVHSKSSGRQALNLFKKTK